ncbi:MAG: MerR family transcriptional regulator [Planctomycetota bacterium]
MSESPQKLYKTGEVLEKSGISRQVLYRYMQMDLIVAAELTATGRSLFADSVFKQIRMIQQLNERYTLRDIREIFSHRIRSLSSSDAVT